MIGCLHPELLLLGIPAGYAWWRTRTSRRLINALRLVAGVLILLALAAPYVDTSASGRDLVFVIDRSRSMPVESQVSAIELIRLAEAERRAGDRLAVVTFGADVHVEQTPRASGSAPFQVFENAVDRDGSEVGAALETALNLIPDDRQGSIVLISDGENNGRETESVSRRAFARGVRIDVRAFPRPNRADLSVERIELPGEVAVGEPFQFNVWVRSDRRVETEFKLERGERVLNSGPRIFEPGLNRVVLRDVLTQAGIAEYRVAVANDDDRVPENNRGLGAVVARGAAAVLVLNHDGSEDTLVRTLRAAQIPVAVAAPERARLDAVGLSAFRAVILENVSASRLGRGLDELRTFVTNRGGGLLMTGGQASFSVGGYYLSSIDDLLPVSLELRQEHRKIGVALAISMDRSGSMSAPVGSGMTKMDLANLGAVAALELLSPIDAISVIAVDSAHHIVQPLTPVDDIPALTKRIRTIESMGGGIFTFTALLAAGKELENAEQRNRHIILFADAADSEEQEDCAALVDEFGGMGITLSVIALGTEQDRDAEFLRSIAEQGGGQAYFTTDPTELPRLFAVDTMMAARATFVEEPAGARVLPNLFGLGIPPTSSFPKVEGYNLTYLRPEGQAGIATTDEYQAPLFAFRQTGLGRTATYAGQIGGSYGQNIVAWDEFSKFFVTVARWLVGQEEPEEFFASVRREGRDAVISVELDSDAELPPDTSQLVARIDETGGNSRELMLERVEEYRYEVRYRLDNEGIGIGSVLLDDERFISLPPIALPYSPEFERSPDPKRGERTLRALARESGGEIDVSASALYRGERDGNRWQLISRPLMLAALLVLLAEIAVRRLALLRSLQLPAGLRSRVAALRAKRNVRRAEKARATAVAPTAAAHHVQSETKPQAPAPEAPTQAAPPAVGSALSRARRAADRKLDR